MRCATCGYIGLVEELITKTYGEGPHALVIQNVPVLRCPNCQTRVFQARTMHVLQVIKDAHNGNIVRYPEEQKAA